MGEPIIPSEYMRVDEITSVSDYCSIPHQVYRPRYLMDIAQIPNSVDIIASNLDTVPTQRR